jgi:prokaryotic ubiquitin-like protein Pup
MAEQEQIRKSGSTRREDADVPEATGSEAAAERAEKLKADLDGLLDEIDEVLEDNAEEFVRNYVQKGGQ